MIWWYATDLNNKNLLIKIQVMKNGYSAIEVIQWYTTELNNKNLLIEINVWKKLHTIESNWCDDDENSNICSWEVGVAVIQDGRPITRLLTTEEAEIWCLTLEELEKSQKVQTWFVKAVNLERYTDYLQMIEVVDAALDMIKQFKEGMKRMLHLQNTTKVRAGSYKKLLT